MSREQIILSQHHGNARLPSFPPTLPSGQIKELDPSSVGRTRALKVKKFLEIFRLEIKRPLMSYRSKFLNKL